MPVTASSKKNGPIAVTLIIPANMYVNLIHTNILIALPEFYAPLTYILICTYNVYAYSRFQERIFVKRIVYSIIAKY